MSVMTRMSLPRRCAIQRILPGICRRRPATDCDSECRARLLCGGRARMAELLVDERDGQETPVADGQEAERRTSLLNLALECVTTRERHIIAERHLKETPTSLATLSHHYSISNERVRQIELQAMVKLQRSMKHARHGDRR
jgi:RNA polymerase sigma-32 factor